MKKLFFIVCCAALLVTGCKDGKNSPESANVHLADSLNEVIAQRDSEINDMMGTFNEVQEGLRQISEAEGRVALAKSGEGTSSKQKMRQQNRKKSFFHARTLLGCCRFFSDLACSRFMTTIRTRITMNISVNSA